MTVRRERERAGAARQGGSASTRTHTAELDRELAWLTRALEVRLHAHFADEPAELPPPPILQEAGSAYARTVADLRLDATERLVLVLALAPHLRPELLDVLFVQNKGLGRDFSEFGGWRGGNHKGFLPTGETAAFVAAGGDLDARVATLSMFRPEHPFASEDLVRLEAVGAYEPELGGALTVPADSVERLATGLRRKPNFSPDFPAKLLTTRLSWRDLVVPPETAAELEHIKAWVRHERRILDGWGLGRALKPGYRCLFYGPPGTGKTLTAALLGQELGLDVYRVDLSLIVSKYIGETEKNLGRVFDRAAHRDWLLFFDEADALFGKRTQTQSSNDRFANQEIAYLLQRVEDLPGVVILATNLKSNIDDAFARRFQSLVHFPMPDAEQRLSLWRGALGDKVRLGGDVRLEELAEQVELAGGGVINVVRHAAIAALNDGRELIAATDLMAGVAKEMRKQGRTL